MLQAIHDVHANHLDVLPIAITHKTRSTTTEVTMRTDEFLYLTKKAIADFSFVGDIRVQIDFQDFLSLLEYAKPWEDYGNK